MNKFAFFLGFLLLTNPVLAGKICKTVDQDGQVRFGDCRGADKEQEIEVKPQSDNSGPSPAQPTDRAERRQRLLDTMEQEREQRKQAREQERADKEKLQRQCAEARDRLKNYRDAGYLYDLDKQGNRQILSQEERERSTRELEAQIKKYCGVENIFNSVLASKTRRNIQDRHCRHLK